MSVASTDVTISYHATLRIAEMGLTPGEVLRALAEPDFTYPSPKRYGDGRMVAVRDRLAVVFSTDGNVITVLWHRREGR